MFALLTPQALHTSSDSCLGTWDFAGFFGLTDVDRIRQRFSTIGAVIQGFLASSLGEFGVFWSKSGTEHVRGLPHKTFRGTPKRYDATGETGRSNMPSDSLGISLGQNIHCKLPDLPRLLCLPSLFDVSMFFLVASASLPFATKEEQLQ